MTIAAVSSASPNNHVFRQRIEDISAPQSVNNAANLSNPNANAAPPPPPPSNDRSAVDAATSTNSGPTFAKTVKTDLTGLTTPVEEKSSSGNTGRDTGRLTQSLSNPNPPGDQGDASPPPDASTTPANAAFFAKLVAALISSSEADNATNNTADPNAVANAVAAASTSGVGSASADVAAAAQQQGAVDAVDNAFAV